MSSDHASCWCLSQSDYQPIAKWTFNKWFSIERPCIWPHMLALKMVSPAHDPWPLSHKKEKKKKEKNASVKLWNNLQKAGVAPLEKKKMDCWFVQGVYSVIVHWTAGGIFVECLWQKKFPLLSTMSASTLPDLPPHKIFDNNKSHHSMNFKRKGLTRKFPTYAYTCTLSSSNDRYT